MLVVLFSHGSWLYTALGSDRGHAHVPTLRRPVIAGTKTALVRPAGVSLWRAIAAGSSPVQAEETPPLETKQASQLFWTILRKGLGWGWRRWVCCCGAISLVGASLEAVVRFAEGLAALLLVAGRIQNKLSFVLVLVAFVFAFPGRSLDLR